MYFFTILVCGMLLWVSLKVMDVDQDSAFAHPYTNLLLCILAVFMLLIFVEI